VLQIAKGRIWTGEDAKGLGLVDEVGGFPVALKLAKQAAGIPEKEDVNLKVYPPKKGPIEMLLEEPPENSEPRTAVEALVRGLREIQPVVRQLRMLGIGADRGVLSMEEVPPAP
jgi:protease-4